MDEKYRTFWDSVLSYMNRYIKNTQINCGNGNLKGLMVSNNYIELQHQVSKFTNSSKFVGRDKQLTTLKNDVFPVHYLCMHVCVFNTCTRM